MPRVLVSGTLKYPRRRPAVSDREERRNNRAVCYNRDRISDLTELFSLKISYFDIGIGFAAHFLCRLLSLTT